MLYSVNAETELSQDRRGYSDLSMEEGEGGISSSSILQSCTDKGAVNTLAPEWCQDASTPEPSNSAGKCLA